MRVTITGMHLPGREFCRVDGTTMDNVHVGVQVRQEPAHLVRADAEQAHWELDVDVVRLEDGFDFRGPAVQGRRGERFIYLTWGHVDGHAHFEMFRRAKLMLGAIPADVVRSAELAGRLAATVDLTDERGHPRCARVDPPALVWSVPQA